MTNGSLVELQARGVIYFSEYDEESFFSWINKIGSVKNLEGRGETLSIFVDPSLLDEYDLREFLALFWRYGIDMSQLVQFDREEFASWFRVKTKYWYNQVFGS